MFFKVCFQSCAGAQRPTSVLLKSDDVGVLVVGLSRRGLLGGVAGTAVVGGAVAAATRAAQAGTAAATGVARAGTVAPRRVLLGSYTSSGGGGIGVGTADPTTGVLSVDGWTAVVPDPSWLAVRATTLYAVSELSPKGTVNALRLNGSALPTVVGKQPTGSGPAHVAVHPSGSWLFTSLYDGGAVVTHPVRSDGSVAPSTDTHADVPAAGQSGPAHPHQIVPDPSGTWLVGTDLGLDTLYVYTVDTSTKKPHQHSHLRLPTGTGPRHLVFSPDGKHLYVANETGSTVTVCAWQTGGSVTALTTVSTRVTTTTSPNYPGEVAVSPDGRFLYVSNRGDNTVAVFAVSADGSAVSLLATPSCGGDWPRHLTLDPTGGWLYVANQNSGDVTWFPVNRTTGLLGAQAGRVVAPGVSQVLFA